MKYVVYPLRLFERGQDNNYYAEQWPKVCGGICVKQTQLWCLLSFKVYQQIQTIQPSVIFLLINTAYHCVYTPAT